MTNNSKELQSIKITEQPLKTEYRYLESFDPSGMTVMAYFSDGSESVVEDYKYSATAFTTLGRQRIAVEYTFDGVTKSTELSVKVQAIEISTPSQKEIPRYNGLFINPSWSGYDSIKMRISGDVSGTFAGSYEARFTANYGYVFTGGFESVTVAWKINRAVILEIPKQNNVLYVNGYLQSPSWDSFRGDILSVAGDLTEKEAGVYYAEFSPASNYEWLDGTTAVKKVAWKITELLVSIPSQVNAPRFDGTLKLPEWKNFDSENSRVTVSYQSDAGEYEAVFTLLKGMWADKTYGNKVVKWKIKRGIIVDVPKQVGAPVYDGNPKRPSWDRNYDPSKMEEIVEAQIVPGLEYQASFVPTKNYEWYDENALPKQSTWHIEPAASTVSVEVNFYPRESEFKPSELEVGFETVYLRRNISKVQKEQKTVWAYEEAQMSKDDALFILTNRQANFTQSLEDADAMNVDQELRLTLLELGLFDTDV